MDGKIIYWCKDMAHWSKFSLLIQQTGSGVMEQVSLGFSRSCLGGMAYSVFFPVSGDKFLIKFIYCFCLDNYILKVDYNSECFYKSRLCHALNSLLLTCLILFFLYTLLVVNFHMQRNVEITNNFPIKKTINLNSKLYKSSTESPNIKLNIYWSIPYIIQTNFRHNKENREDYLLIFLYIKV